MVLRAEIVVQFKTGGVFINMLLYSKDIVKKKMV